jgi:hypothetical protein
MIRFLIGLLVAALVISGSVLAGVRLDWIAHAPSRFVEILIFLFLSTFILYTYLYRAAPGANFAQLYLLTVVLKLLGYAGFGFIIIWTDREGAAYNSAFFIITYIVFTALEVAFLYRKITSGNKP